MAIDQKWKDTMQKGINDAKWDKYDKTIKVEVDTYGKIPCINSQSKLATYKGHAMDREWRP